MAETLKSADLNVFAQVPNPLTPQKWLEHFKSPANSPIQRLTQVAQVQGFDAFYQRSRQFLSLMWGDSSLSRVAALSQFCSSLLPVENQVEAKALDLSTLSKREQLECQIARLSLNISMLNLLHVIGHDSIKALRAETKKFDINPFSPLQDRLWQQVTQIQKDLETDFVNKDIIDQRFIENFVGDYFETIQHLSNVYEDSRKTFGVSPKLLRKLALPIAAASIAAASFMVRRPEEHDIQQLTADHIPTLTPSPTPTSSPTPKPPSDTKGKDKLPLITKDDSQMVLPENTSTPIESGPTATPTPEPTKVPDQTVYIAIKGDTLTKIARKYGVTVKQLVDLNKISDPNLIIVGQKIIIPRKSTVDTPQSLSDSKMLEVKPNQRNGSVITAIDPVGAELAVKYQNQLFTSLEEMPDELRIWYVNKVVEISQKFNFPPELVLAIHWAEQVGNGYRPFEARSSRFIYGTVGPGQWTPGSWNGSTNPVQDKFVMDPVEIIKYKGLGIDYQHVDLWLAAEKGDKEALQKLVDLGSLADPRKVPDNIAATIRHLEADLKGRRDDKSIRTAAWHYVGGNSAYVELVLARSKILAKELKNLTSISFEEALNRSLDNIFGRRITSQELDGLKQTVTYADFKAGKISQNEAVFAIVNNIRESYLAQGRLDNGLNWPHYANEQYALVQEASNQILGHMLAYEELKELMDKYDSNIDKIKADLESRSDAQLYRYARELVPKMLSREKRGLYTYREEIRDLLITIIQNRFGIQDPHKIDPAVLEGAKVDLENDLKKYLLTLPECKNNCPLILTAPKVGRIFSGPYKLRDVIRDKQGEKGPSELHGNIDYYWRNKVEGWNYRKPWNWYGEDFQGYGSVLSPITGVVEEVVAFNEDGDDGGNAVGIGGTGEFEGFYFKVLHLGEVKAKLGQKVDTGNPIGTQSTIWKHVHGMLMYDKLKTGHPSWGFPVPMEFLFTDGAGPGGKYSSYNWEEGDVVINDGLRWLLLDALNW